MTDTDKPAASRSADSEPVDTTVDPTQKTRGMDADTEQNADERGEAIRQFDDHMDSAGDEQKLPTPDAEDVTADRTDPKTTQRSEQIRL